MLHQPLTLTARIDCDLLDGAGGSERVVELTIRAPRAPVQRETRPPLNLALVIDRSGSMGGEKLAYAKRAAQQVLTRLTARDRIAVVAYDDQIDIVSSSSLVTDADRATISSSIEALTPRASTNLGEGWLRGAALVAEFVGPDVISRVLLLTDGLANQGITSEVELADHAQELRRRGVSTSAFGVGADFNEHLLKAMAEAGGGHFYFIETPDHIPTILAQELGELLTVVAREPQLTISGPNEAAVEVLGGHAFEYDGENVHVPLSDIFEQEERKFYLRVLAVAQGAECYELPIRATLTYRDLSGDPKTVSAVARFNYANSEVVAAAPQDHQLQQTAVGVRLSEIILAALKLDRAGSRPEALALLESALSEWGRRAAPPEAARVRGVIEELRRGMSPISSKQRHFEEYRKLKSR
jgi:Ca-activated chloride channel family protein